MLLNKTVSKNDCEEKLQEVFPPQFVLRSQNPDSSAVPLSLRMQHSLGGQCGVGSLGKVQTKSVQELQGFIKPSGSDKGGVGSDGGGTGLDGGGAGSDGGGVCMTV